MKTRILLFTCSLISTSVLAQYPLVTIQDIQEVSQTNLGNCIDESLVTGDTVIVMGKVVMDGGLDQLTTAKQIWLQSGNGGAWSGLDVYDLIANGTTVDVDNLLAGDSIEVIGKVTEYQGETELEPIGPNSLTILGQSQPVYPAVVDVGDLNDGSQNNVLTTGEAWEGAFVEIQDVTVVSVDYFSSNTRVSFIVQDQQGNLINVSDRFLVQRLPASGGSFVPPNVGDQFQSIMGVILHSKNNCTGNNGRGYEIHPFDASHYVYSLSSPQVSNILRTPLVPNSSQTVSVTADIDDPDGTVQNAALYWATGTSGGTFTQVSMTFVSGTQYSATIPAQVDGMFVRWYITATDNDALTTYVPSNTPATNTFFYRVRNGGLTVYDLQYTPYPIGSSGYVDEEVTVEGVVTASLQATGVGDLGYVYMQQENQDTYAGIWLLDPSQTALNTLERGDKVSVTGTVAEINGMTQLNAITGVNVTGTGSIDPVVLNPDSFSTYDAPAHEQYESMLVTFEHPVAGGRLFVVDTNADGPADNFAEYRIGTDALLPANGVRVIAGRQFGTYAYSSLWCSFVNSEIWASTMNVRPYIVGEGNSMASASGILFYSFGNMKLLPRNNDDIIDYSGPVTAVFETNLDTACVDVNDTVIFTNTSSVIADILDWDFGDGTNGSAEVENHIYTQVGLYDIELTARNSFDNVSDTYTMTLAVTDDGDCAVGIAGPRTAENQVTMYPNPSREGITIETNFGNGATYEVCISDLQGRQVLRRVTVSDKAYIDLGDLVAGAYVLEVKNTAGETVQVQKFVKQ